MNKQRISSYLALPILSVLSFSASAHTGGEALHGFIDGFMHPWQGLDHLLAMLAIGVWAAVTGGRHLWLLPSAFLIAMTGGALINFAGVLINGVEIGVAFSVFALGLILAFDRRLSLFSAIGLVALFALGHGYVHAAEVGSEADALVYAVGFLTATATLHATGMAAGLTGTGALKAVRNLFALICTVTGAALLVGV